jgi:hypothetical protein
LSGAAPDFVAPVVGWRVWLVTRHAGDFRLRSVLYPTPWIPREPMIGSCAPGRPGRMMRHAAPTLECSCGVYAAASLDEALGYFDGHAPGVEDAVYRVIGRVALWGTVVEGERGWRASHAYPERLYVPAEPLDRAATVSGGAVALALTDYGVPVELLDGVTKRRISGLLSDERAAA